MNASDDIIENITYDELHVGQTARLCRTLTKEDIAAFAAVSGDVNPAHVDPEYAGHTLFHGVIAHGMWGAALISRLLGTVLPGPGTIYLGQTLQFLKPVRIGDELRITATVTSMEPAKKHVLLDCEIKNQTGAVVLNGVATVIAPSEKVRRPRVHMPSISLSQVHANYASLMEAAAPLTPVRCGVVHPCDEASLRGALDAAAHKLIVPVLIAPEARLRALAEGAGLSLEGVELVDVPHSHAAAARAAAMAAAGEVEMLMKGSLHTDEMISAVLAAPGLRTARRLSHVFRIEVPLYDKVLLISDGALNIQPTLDDKVDIVQNAIELAHALGTPQPKVAILSAVETVTPKIPSTLDAAALCKMAERGQISGALLDGPLAFDNAISPMAARVKGIVSEVAGHADILIAPDLEAGNLLAKQLEYLAGAAVCGVVLGAAVPIALTSRADDAAARTASAALALMLAHRYRQQHP
ncbi:bifunctional enoyl-CoA hydratase/phosphate acetyltransferase [Duganella sp. BJB488]|uniref:bifunctional enoyl-CoA hydratase/phosphate acetyltransferase n=1 Tax=unclassified Duganella TaxID=2636909 RepID=UPI000E3528CB|nr:MULTISPECIES: bifunctional enoyl-CoA hydratase/phosphate acetyltransferase [unclassified Duganella]RFP17708.1 bifunctional enoyl-CoA hydratase/phosphate acetyltransferase [Duganella sp. BJB489]RFP22217.1 bifunctional enoyl-CoA hydratase/phosphate acetyltransferase [Duganella sp. BJB488]RFP37551.1 bifunctional enoyl-CoA hydratase/phosphate acetyltransferase [Duganella sp. BJB480]